MVAPSLPGYGFSSAPKQPGFGIKAMAATVNELMLKLGYARYVAQGGRPAPSCSMLQQSEKGKIADKLVRLACGLLNAASGTAGGIGDGHVCKRWCCSALELP